MWALYAIAASILWGVDYALTERVLKKIQFSTLLTIELFVAFLVMLGVTIVTGAYRSDFPQVFSSGKIGVATFAIVVAFNLANVLIVLAIKGGNATIAGLIEISYPLFIALFSWLLFRENTINWGTAVGGALVCVGVSVILLLNR